MSYVFAFSTLAHSKYTDVAELARQIVMLDGSVGIVVTIPEKSDHPPYTRELPYRFTDRHLTRYSPPAATVQENDARLVSTVTELVFTSVVPL